MSHRVKCPDCGHEVHVPEIVPVDPFDHPVGCGECDLVCYPADEPIEEVDDA